MNSPGWEINLSKCMIKGCDAKVWERDLCGKHYRRWLRHGDPLKVLIGNQVCSVCGEKHYSGGFCQKHYRRNKRHGDPNYNATEEAFRYLTDVVLKHKGKRECLTWPFKLAGKGYATVTINGVPGVPGEQRYVCRIVCERLYGPPQTSYHQAAHSCGRGHKGCVNPHHLRWTTPSENAQDTLDHGTGRNQFGSFTRSSSRPSRRSGRAAQPPRTPSRARR